MRRLKSKLKKRSKKALTAYGKWFKGRCQKFGKFDYELTQQKCLEEKMKKK